MILNNRERRKLRSGITEVNPLYLLAIAFLQYAIINTNLEAQVNRASQKLDLQTIKEIKENLAPLTDLSIYHSRGFRHQKLLIYTDFSPWHPEVSIWGLVPHWVKNIKQLKELCNKILNANRLHQAFIPLKVSHSYWEIKKRIVQ